jgi:uncharacterized protein (TIGR00369 family)
MDTKMNKATELSELLASQPKPECASLTPFEIIEADFDTGTIILQFAAQPAFSNHWGNIQGGFGVAMLDVLISLSAYARLGQWSPTIEIKTSFLAPLKVGVCKGKGQIIKVGKSIAFLEAELWGPEGELAMQATATVSVRTS